MRFSLFSSPPPLRHSASRRSIGGLTKQYIKVGQSAKNRLFGVPSSHNWEDDRTPLQMLVSGKGSLSKVKVILMSIGAFLIVLGTILSSIPLVDFILFKNLHIWNGTLAYSYWQKPGVQRLTKVFIFNVTNPDAIIDKKAKPILEEIGPFVYSEDMEKVNIQFHDNGTVTFQHRKILQFRPELSVNRNTRLILPNIPVLTASSIASGFAFPIQLGLAAALAVLRNSRPFTRMTADQLLFGYHDPIIMAAHYTFPKHLRPQKEMGLLLGRNATVLKEFATINTGRDDITKFGLIETLNGLDHLPQWKPPCNSVRASEGSFFPPRAYTGLDTTAVYDKDLCRILPLKRRYTENHEGIVADHFTPVDDALDPEAEGNSCFCSEERYGLDCPPKGLQDISACQFGAPIYLSYPHFLGGDPQLVKNIDGLKPDPIKHETFFKINPRLGVPVQAQVRVQANIIVKRAPSVRQTRNFPEFAFPLMWLQEGLEELTPPIRRWIILANVAHLLVDIISYGSIALGFGLLVGISTYTYRKQVFSKETIEKGKKTIRRGSSFIVNGQHRLLIIRDSYTRLNTTPDVDMEPDPDRDSS